MSGSENSGVGFRLRVGSSQTRTVQIISYRFVEVNRVATIEVSWLRRLDGYD